MTVATDLRPRGYAYLINITRGSRTKYAADFAAEDFTPISGRSANQQVDVKTITDPEDPDQPRDLGYAIGSRIAEAYYRNAPNSVQAAREMMGVTDYPAFLARSGYVESLRAIPSRP